MEHDAVLLPPPVGLADLFAAPTPPPKPAPMPLHALPVALGGA